MQCHVRFSEENGAQEAFKALKEKAEITSDEEKISIEVLGQKVEVNVVSDEEETKFWREFQSRQFNKNRNNNNKWQSKSNESVCFPCPYVAFFAGGKKRFNNDNGGRKNKVVKTGGD